jgi:TrmH family RNA methyltransferase
MVKITSVQNGKVKEIARLSSRKGRDESGFFLIEGTREVQRAKAAGFVIEELLFCPTLFSNADSEALLESDSMECSEEVFHKLCYREGPDGILAVAKQKHRKLSQLKLQPNTFIVVAESIEKPGNLGTILRSSDAAGVDAVFVCDPTTDIYNPNVVRSSVGTLFSVPIYEVTSYEARTFFKENHISIVAATPHAKEEFTQANFQGPVAIAVGSEQLGLSETWMNQANIQVRIPMMGIADSLNVASATTLILYEVLRQRRSHL